MSGSVTILFLFSFSVCNKNDAIRPERLSVLLCIWIRSCMNFQIAIFASIFFNILCILIFVLKHSASDQFEYSDYHSIRILNLLVTLFSPFFFFSFLFSCWNFERCNMLCQFSKIGTATRGRVLENGVPCCLSFGSSYNRKANSNKPSLYRGLPSDVRFSSSLPTQAQVMDMNF